MCPSSGWCIVQNKVGLIVKAGHIIHALVHTKKQLQVESIDNIVLNINSVGVIFIHNHTPGFIALQDLQ